MRKQYHFRKVENDTYIWDVDHLVELTQSFKVRQVPLSDIKELDDSYVVEAELPGMKKENISLNFENNVLTIEGKQTEENNEEDNNGRVIHRERSVRDVKRQFSFNNIQEDAIKASYDNGMLNVTLPKRSKEDNSNSNIQID